MGVRLVHTRISRTRKRRTGQLAVGAALLVLVEGSLAVGVAGAAPQSVSEETSTAQPAKRPSGATDSQAAARKKALRAKGSLGWAIAQAKSSGKKIAATDETTATTSTVANPDGTVTTELTAGPERVWRDGAWRKVDVTLIKSADGSVRAKEHPNGLRLAGKGGSRPKSISAAQGSSARDLVTLGSGEDRVTLQWKGGLPEPQLDGTRARYQDAVPGADVLVEATRTGFEQFVEIAEKPANGNFAYTLPLQAKGMTAKAGNDDSVVFTDAETGDVRATMPAPVMWDSAVDKVSGEHTRRARVGMEVVDKGRGEIDLVVTPDADFLATRRRSTRSRSIPPPPPSPVPSTRTCSRARRSTGPTTSNSTSATREPPTRTERPAPRAPSSPGTPLPSRTR